MKIQLTFKDPDGVYDAVSRAVEESLAPLQLEDAEFDALYEVRREKVMNYISKWCRWGEYLDVVIDTEEDTATVIKAK